MTTSATHLVHPLAGVTDDLERCFQQFEARGSLRFVEFAAVWRELQLPFLWYGRRTEVELRFLCDGLFFQLLKQTQPPLALHRRICALYLLQAVHHKLALPYLPGMHVRCTLPQWKNLLELEELLREEQHLDALYVFRTMTASRAFTFCVTPFPYYPGVPALESFDDVVTKTLAAGDTAEGALGSILSAERLDNMKQLASIYSKAKEELTKDAVASQVHLDFVQEDAADHIAQLVDKIRHQNTTKAAAHVGRIKHEDFGSGEEDDAATELMEEQGIRRRRLKQKAMEKGRSKKRRAQSQKSPP